jgi:hypothetical protein
MNNEKTVDPNSPAFPVHPSKNPDGYGSGINLRTYIATEAMKGLLSFYGDEREANFVSANAVWHADELIKELINSTI